MVREPYEKPDIISAQADLNILRTACTEGVLNPPTGFMGGIPECECNPVCNPVTNINC